jgi:hypothetical protein
VYVVAAFAGDDALLIMRPVVAEGVEAPETRAQRGPQEVLRRGRVQLATDYFFAVSPAGQRRAAERSYRGRTVDVVVFEDRVLRVMLDGESRREGLVSVSGRLEGHDLSTFSLTVGPEAYVMDVQDMEEGVHYRIVGETATGEGSVEALDARAVPGFTYSEPLLPPAGTQ